MKARYMEMMKKSIAFVLAIMLVALTGCRPLFTKLYYDYPNVWVSEDGKVTLDPSGLTTILYEEINQDWVIYALSDSGGRSLSIEFEDPNAVDDSSLIWKAYATIKQDVLYLEIKKDIYTGLEGETIVLKQSDIPSELYQSDVPSE